MTLLPLAFVLITMVTTQPADPLAVEPPSLDVPFAAVTPALTADPADPAWASAVTIASLTPSVAPGKPAPALQPTEVRLMWDASSLYVRFICQDTDIRSEFTQRDQPLYEADVVEVFLDVVGDGRQYFELQVSPNNVVFDQNITITAEPRHQPSGILERDIIARDHWPEPGYTMKGLRTAAARVTLEGNRPAWVVDVAIPAKPALRRLGAEAFAAGQTLRANLLRYDYEDATLKAGNWSAVRHGCPHISPSRMGRLRLVRP